MTKRMIIMLIIVGLLFGGIFGFQAFKGSMIKKYMASAGIPPQTVSSIKATVEDWQPQIDTVGSLRAFRGADLSSEVAGIVEEIKFESGAEVKAGSVLVQLRAEDDIAAAVGSPYHAALLAIVEDGLRTGLARCRVAHDPKGAAVVVDGSHDAFEQ